MSLVAELALGLVTAKHFRAVDFPAGLSRYLVVRTRTDNPNDIQLAGAGETDAYGRIWKSISLAEVTAGENIAEVKKFVPGDEITCIAAGPIPTDIEVAVAANGRIDFMAPSATPVLQYVFGKTLSASTDAGDEIRVRLIMNYQLV